MTTFTVHVPENKVSFFKKLMSRLGSTFTEEENHFVLSEEQKQILDQLDTVSLESYTSAEAFFDEIKTEYSF